MPHGLQLHFELHLIRTNAFGFQTFMHGINLAHPFIDIAPVRVMTQPRDTAIDPAAALMPHDDYELDAHDFDRKFNRGGRAVKAAPIGSGDGTILPTFRVTNICPG